MYIILQYPMALRWNDTDSRKPN